MLVLFHNDPAKKSVRTATKLRHGQTSNKYELCSVAAAGWNLAALRTEHLKNPDIGPIVQEVETGQQPDSNVACRPVARQHSQHKRGQQYRNSVFYVGRWTIAMQCVRYST
jgi:hypothetical protein